MLMLRYTYLSNIETWWSVLDASEQIFWAIAVVFSVLFFIQFVLSLFELEFESGNNFIVNADFQLLSVKSIIAFFTFFGWTGVLMSQGRSSLLTSTVVALVSGLIAMFIVSYMMFWFAKLNKAGNVDIHEALFTAGEVYLTIPPNKSGRGKVHFQVGKSLREMDAITEHINSIPNGTSVTITDILDNDLLVVEPSKN